MQGANPASESPTAAAQRWIETINPGTEALINRYPVAQPAEIDQAFADARLATPAWQAVPIAQRAILLEHLADRIRFQADLLAADISRETGKPLKQAMDNDLLPALSLLAFYARQGERFLRDAPLPADNSRWLGRQRVRRFVPHGVVGVITPWNFPFSVALSGVATALLAGNTVILKPSEMTPGVGLALTQLVHQVLAQNNLPQNVMQCLIGDGQTGWAVAQQSDALVFTGSNTVGLALQQAMAEQGKPISAEMGGSDPMIVLPGCDLDVISSHALWGRFINAGQACAAVKRLFVPRGELHALIPLLQHKVEQLRPGLPEDPTVTLGPLISRRQREQLHAQVTDALQLGATLISGGNPLARPGWFYAPTLLTDVPPQARILREEVFGPVLPIIAYDTPEAAIAMANDQPFGLGASVFGPEPEARAVALRLHAGMVAINDVAMSCYGFPGVPWQGVKQSGQGVSHGKEGLLALTRPQTVMTNRLFGIPALAKMPWHFDKAPSGAGLAFSRRLLNAFGRQDILSKLDPLFLAGLWQNRASRKL